MKFRTLIIGAALTLSLVACSKSKFDKLQGEADGFADKMCDCKDKECTDKVKSDYKAWEKTAFEGLTEDDLKGASESAMKKAEETDKRMKECRKKYDK